MDEIATFSIRPQKKGIEKSPFFNPKFVNRIDFFTTFLRENGR